MAVKHFLLVATALVGLLSVTRPAHAQAGVIFEDYAGPNASGSAYLPPGTPTFNNPELIAAGGLLPLHLSGATPRRTGTEANLDWPQEVPRLCADYDLGSGTPSAVAACNLRIMGRVLYTVVRVPFAGNLGFYIAHDDNAKVDISSDYRRPTTYRTATWDLPVGSLTSYTVDSNSFSRIGAVVSPAVNSCMLLRVAWSNTGGRNYMRLGYRTTTTAPIAFVSAANLIDPRDSARINSLCSTAVQPAPTIQLSKVIDGARVQPSDQFSLFLRQDGVATASGTTSGSNTTLALPRITAGAGSAPVLTIEETISSGSSLQPYVTSAVCTNSGSTTPLALTSVDTAANPKWQLPALSSGQNVSCTITNKQASSNLGLTKTSAPAGPWRNGQAVTYTLTARNNGPDAAHGSVLRDPAVAGLNCATFTCAASGSAQCGSASGAASVLQGAGLAIPQFPLNGVVTVTLSCTVSASGMSP